MMEMESPLGRKKLVKQAGFNITRQKDSVDQLIKSTMKAGSGGETSESDIEAILFSIEHDSLADAVLLIGDNFSDVRDLSILNKVNKKVHIIICSAPQKIRVDYLNIAKSTGGILYWNGVKIDLSSVGRGEMAVIGNHRYKWGGKTFKLQKSKVPGM